MQRHQFTASYGRATDLNDPPTSRPVRRAASEIALPHMNASTRRATTEYAHLDGAFYTMQRH
jgi:hypothetical protein